MKKYTFLLIAILIAGCKTTQQVPIQSTTEIKDTVIITEDPVWTVPMEVYWKMLFECDSNYEVLLRDYESLNTGLHDAVEIREVIKWREDNTRVKQLSVNISALIDSIEMQNTTIERLRRERVKVEVPVKVPGPEVIKNSHFANFTIWFFWIAVIAGVCYVIVRFKLWKVFFKNI